MIRDIRIIEFIKKDMNLDKDLIRVKNITCGSPWGDLFFTDGEDVCSFRCACKRCKNYNYGCEKCPYLKETRKCQKDGYPIYLSKLDHLTPLYKPEK